MEEIEGWSVSTPIRGRTNNHTTLLNPHQTPSSQHYSSLHLIPLNLTDSVVDPQFSTSPDHKGTFHRSGLRVPCDITLCLCKISLLPNITSRGFRSTDTYNI
jgi:hypothetical protein